jgi:tripeptidyl-peptidase-2
MRRATVVGFTGLMLLGAALWDAAGRAAETKPFPTAGWLPKEEIGAKRFLESHPQWDGRGVVVAVLDSGVDPGAPGLQETSDGRPKIVDLVDGTGSGDVDTREVRKPDDEALAGLSGRTLKLNPKWLKKGREFHVGLKRGFDLFPPALADRVRKERGEQFDEQQNAAVEQLRRQLAAWEESHPRASKAAKLDREELQARLDQLTLAARQYEDPGPLYDCVVFHDGRCWRAVVDTDEDGDLTDETALTNYRDERQYATLGGGTELNFGVNIYDEGRRLSLVVTWDAHGTHVAGIVAGYLPEQPEFNGIAPGAQIVSVKIGDSRLAGSETISGMLRGLRTVLDNRCDLINMSYGEPTTNPNGGRVLEWFEELVDEHGVLFVAAAGNDGPALSTVIAPGGTSSAVLGVGAYVSPEMAGAEYTLRELPRPTAYTWSSRGPTFDGDTGVRMLAPGGALAAVPPWTLDRRQQKHGTSMASPNACGAAALLVSALRSETVAYSPHSIRRALENTAQRVEGTEPWAQGAGLIQVDRAWEYLVRHASAGGELWRCRVELAGREEGRGIYLREFYETGHAVDHTVKIEPLFPRQTEPGAKSDFELKVLLESSVAWVQVGEALVLTAGGRSIPVRVDPTGLPPGAHFAEVVGRDATAPERGPLFHIPVTAIICHNTAVNPVVGDAEADEAAPTPPVVPARRVRKATVYRDVLALAAGAPERRFLAVPVGATGAEVKLRRIDSGEPMKFYVHTLQKVPDRPFPRTDSRHHVRLASGDRAGYAVALDDGHTLEVCVAQDWSNVAEAKVALEVNFTGVLLDDREIVLPKGQQSVRVEVSSLLQKETIAPKVQLTKRRRTLPPVHDVLRPLDAERDRLPNGQPAYELLLTYEFELEKPARVTLRFPHTDELLYDSPFGGRLWMLFDAQKRRLEVGGVTSSSISLEKGKYTVLMPHVHEDPALLQSLRKSVMYVEQPLSKFIPLRVFASRAAAAAGRREVTERTLLAGEQIGLYVRAPTPEELPSELKPGEWLLGTATFDRTDAPRAAEPSRAERYRILWGGLPVERDVAAKPKAAAPAGRKTVGRLVDDVRDFEVEQLEQLVTGPDDGPFDEFAARLRERYSDHLPIRAAVLHRLDGSEQRMELLGQIVKTADELLQQIDQDELARRLGVKAAPDDARDDTKAAELRDLLVDALYHKGLALADQELPEVLKQHPLDDPRAHGEAIEENFRQFQKWAVASEGKHALLAARYEWRQERYGQALSLLDKALAALPPDSRRSELRVQLYRLLGWNHLADAERKWIVLRFPKTYEPF